MPEVVVRAICSAFISSSNAAQSCKDVPGVDDEVANENCVEDIQVIILRFLFVFNESCLQLQLISTVAWNYFFLNKRQTQFVINM